MRISETKDRKHFLLRLLTIYIALICISIALQSISNYRFLLDELSYLSAPYYDFKGVAKGLVYLLSYALSIALIFLFLFQGSQTIFSILIAYLLTSYFIDTSSQLIGSRSGFTHFQYVLFLNEARNYKNLLIFWSEISKALAITGLLGVVLVLIRNCIGIRIAARWLLLTPLCFVPVVVAKLGVYYITYPAYPSPIKTPLIIVYYHLTKQEQPIRVLPPQVAAGENLTDNIVLIIDESISGSYLSINGYKRSTTPDLEEYVKQGVVTNFGVVNSIANCSAFSQLALRIGLSANTEGANHSYVAIRKSLPTIYQFAKRAGYKTWLIDSQVDEGALTNYLTYEDLKDVDEYFTLSTRTEDYKRDFIALEKFKSIIEKTDGKKKFIVFVKDGAHWPYLWRIPKSSILFEPVQASEYEPMVRENKEKVLNTYANLIRYTVNDFLKLYIKIVNMRNAITFYTSDHGQAFMEDGAKDNLTHCSSFHDPVSSQVAVPLLVIESSGNSRYVSDTRKLYSQDQIFPSMLMEMGYSDDITKRYGNTLLNGYPANTDRWFYWSLEGDRSLYKPNNSTAK